MRNKSIDFFRGLIAIHIIMIHTVFHSGDLYVDSSIKCWSLLFDVPIFLLLSGMVYSFKESPKKKINELINILFKWAIFVLLCYSFLFFIDKQNLFFKDLPSWFVFNPLTNSNYIYGIKNSLWFMIPFIESTLICSLLIYFVKLKAKNENEIIKSILLLMLLFMFFLISANNNIYYFNLRGDTIYFCIFYLLEYISMKVSFKNIFSVIFIEIITFTLFILLFKANNYNISDLQSLKANCSFIYVLSSLFSSFLIIYLKDHVKFESKIFKPIIFIGKNALYLYFAQGLSSSLMYFLVPKININNIYLKILTMFTINLCTSILIFLVLIGIYKILDIFQKKAQNFKLFEKLKILN